MSSISSDKQKWKKHPVWKGKRFLFQFLFLMCNQNDSRFSCATKTICACCQEIFVFPHLWTLISGSVHQQFVSPWRDAQAILRSDMFFSWAKGVNSVRSFQSSTSLTIKFWRSKRWGFDSTFSFQTGIIESCLWLWILSMPNAMIFLKFSPASFGGELWAQSFWGKKVGEVSWNQSNKPLENEY